MSTLIDEPADATLTGLPAERLRSVTAAIRLSFTWFGTRKTLTHEQKAQAAESFGAEGDFLSAGKKLIDTRHPQFRAVSAVRHRAVAFWKAVTLPFPEPGVRLLRRDDVAAAEVQLTTLRAELTEAVAELDGHYAELKRAARERLGSLYNEADYPTTLRGLFDMSWDYPSVEPPDYLRRLSPELYREECRRVAARFDEAVQLAEQAFVEELSKLVTHLTERLTGQVDGKPKVFRDSAVGNLVEFFERFRHLNVGSSAELDDLVGHAQRIVRGLEPQELRDSRVLRDHVAQQLGSVQTSLDELLVDRPRRNILRRPR